VGVGGAGVGKGVVVADAPLAAGGVGAGHRGLGGTGASELLGLEGAIGVEEANRRALGKVEEVSSATGFAGIKHRVGVKSGGEGGESGGVGEVVGSGSSGNALLGVEHAGVGVVWLGTGCVTVVLDTNRLAVVGIVLYDGVGRRSAHAHLGDHRADESVLPRATCRGCVVVPYDVTGCDLSCGGKTSERQDQ